MDFGGDIDVSAQVGSSVVTNAPLWWGMLIMRELCICGWAGGMWEISISSCPCCPEPKPALKKSKKRMCFLNLP